MKKKLQEQREKAIIESFAKVFNKIKRSNEPEAKLINEDLGIGGEPNYDEIVKKAIVELPWDNVKIDINGRSRFSWGGECTEYSGEVDFNVDGYDIRVTFGRWCDADEDGLSTGMYRDIFVNGKGVGDIISKPVYKMLSNELLDYDNEVMG